MGIVFKSLLLCWAPASFPRDSTVVVISRQLDFCASGSEVLGVALWIYLFESNVFFSSVTWNKTVLLLRYNLDDPITVTTELNVKLAFPGIKICKYFKNTKTSLHMTLFLIKCFQIIILHLLRSTLVDLITFTIELNVKLALICIKICK